MKTASWYIPWDYAIAGHGRKWEVRVTNGAGQHVCTATFFTKNEAAEWVADHKLNRAREFGALLEEPC